MSDQLIFDSLEELAKRIKVKVPQLEIMIDDPFEPVTASSLKKNMEEIR